MHIEYNLVILASAIALASCEYCEPVTIDSCLSAGYKLTARFPDIRGQPYQDVQASRLNLYIPLLTSSCSQYASTILCSLYVPKCEEGRLRPWVPCRAVCSKFVGECFENLRYVGLAGLLTALCDLLPNDTQQCFYPANFPSSSSSGDPPKTNECYNVTHQKCKNDLHYNYTFVPPNYQTALETVFSSMTCSKQLEKFLCYTQFPPCELSSKPKTTIPCQSLCDTIDKDCWKEFKKVKIPLPHCDFIFPNKIGNNGLCEITEWPAPWPKPTEFRPAPSPIGTCEALTVDSCANAGYNLTAKFAANFQSSVGKLLDKLLPHLQSCSSHSSLILCSLYLPKCINGYGRPVLPCRQVCLDFAKNCVIRLRLVSLAGMSTALCDLLPVYDGSPDKCIMPSGFALKNPISKRNVCYKVTSSMCSDDLHYDHTFVPPENQNASELTILQPIINRKCSPDIERYLCYSRLPPCTADTSVVHLPCNELCERIKRDCGDEYKALRIPSLSCDTVFPPGDSSSGLCNLTQWPAPWPWKIPEPPRPTSAGPAQCVPLTATACKKAGYTMTAKFPEIRGQPYQQVRSENLENFLRFLRLCSDYSEAVMCSLTMPKCVEGLSRPVLPCRSVCLEFVGKCKTLLSLASHGGLFRALCDLLPDRDTFPNTCFIPKGFKPTIPAVANRGGTCSKIVQSKFCSEDLHYNQTFIAEKDQSNESILKSILKTNCSRDFEKYLCYTNVPPCKPNDVSVFVPCSDICEQVKRDCAGEFEKQKIPLIDCSWIYPDESHPTGLCKLSKFPAPWPTKQISSGGKTSDENSTKTISRHPKATKTNNKGGMIAGIVVGVLVLIAALIIAAVMYIRWRRNVQPFAAQRFNNEPGDVKL